MSESTVTAGTTFLIYADGYPEAGLELSEEQLHSEIAAGRLCGYDLIWYDGVWRQLAEVFELEKPGTAVCVDESEVDIALKFKELQPFGISISTEMKDAGRQAWVKLGLRELVYRRDGRRRPIWQILTLVIFIVVVSVVAFLYCLVPGFNWLFWRPANVLVLNPYPSDCSILFDGQTYSLPGNGSVTVSDIFGRMPRVEKMVITHLKDGDEKVIRIPLRAGETVLVNPMEMLFLGVMRTDSLVELGRSSEISSVVKELMSWKAPVTALRLADKAKEQGKNSLVASTDSAFIYSSDPIVTEHHFSFEELGYVRSAADLSRGDAVQPASGYSTANLLRGLRAGGMSVHFRKGSDEVAECSFRVTLPGKGGFDLVKRHGKQVPGEYRAFAPLTGSGTCTVRFEAKQTVVGVAFDKRDFHVKRNQRSLFGRWTYKGIYDLAEKRWSWHWEFNGQDKVRVAKLRLTLSQNGKVVVNKYDERRPPGRPPRKGPGKRAEGKK